MTKLGTLFLTAFITLFLAGSSIAKTQVVRFTPSVLMPPSTVLDSLHDQLMQADDSALAQIDGIKAKIEELRISRKAVVVLKQQLSDLTVKINTAIDSSEKHKYEDQREDVQKQYNVEAYKQGLRADSVLKAVELTEHMLAEIRASIFGRLGQLPTGGEYEDFKQDSEEQFTRFGEQMAGLRKQVMAMRA